MYPVPTKRSFRIAMLVFCSSLLSIPYTHSQCIAVGPNNPSTSANVPYTGSDYEFDDPLNTLNNDNNMATAASLASIFNRTTDYLQVKNFGFNIPTAASICGIEAHIRKSASDIDILLISAWVRDYDVRLIKNNVLTGDNLKNATEWTNSNATTTYGDVNELWGTTWTPADVNSNNFGLSIAAEIKTGIGLLPIVGIDHISLTVHYLDPTTLPAQAVHFNVANASNRSALISWKQGAGETASYVVERSANGHSWETVNGNTQKNNALRTFTDTRPLTGKSYYRLKMVTPEGGTRYTASQPFELIDHTTLTCYPNPFTSTIQVKGIMAGERVAVTNMYGQCMYLSAPAINNAIAVNINDLQPGVYVISVGNRKMKVEKR